MSVNKKINTDAYGDDSIEDVGGLRWILDNPNNHLTTTDAYAQFHVIREILDNSVDECEQQASPGNLVELYLFLDRRGNTYQTVIKDTGRGVPINSLKRSFTTVFTTGKSRKNENSSYKAAGGLNGIGSKVAMVLANHFRVFSKRDGVIASLYTKAIKNKQGHEDIQIGDLEVDNFVSSSSGTMVIMEPRSGIFTEVDEFINEKYIQLVHQCRLVSMMSNRTKIIVKIVNKPLSKNIWTMPSTEVEEYMEKRYFSSEQYVNIDCTNKESNIDYIKSLWGVEGSFQWQLEKIAHPLINNVGFNISLYLPRLFKMAVATTMVNNIPIKDQNSSHITCLYKCIKKRLSDFVVNTEKDDFNTYFNEIYKLPFCSIISVKYTQAKFTSLAKDGFKMPDFEKEYIQMLDPILDQVDGKCWFDLFLLIQQDIINKYYDYHNKPMLSKKDSSKMTLAIGDKDFYDCTKHGPNSEIFIVEGLSASHIVQGRNPDTQAVYCIFGKPKNVVRSDKGSSSAELFNGYKPYKKLAEILNINFKQTDLSTARYGKIILMSDADIDGAHIRALHISSLLMLNEKILESGMVYLANPALYEVSFSKRSKQIYYIQDKPALIKFFTECIYQHVFDFSVMDGVRFKTPTKLKGKEYFDFCKIMTLIGEIFEELSNKLSIPPTVLENITHCTHLLRGEVNIHELEAYLGEGASYDKDTGTIYIPSYTPDEPDVIFPLKGGTLEVIYNELMGILHKISWKQLQVYITTKKTDVCKEHRIHICQIYQYFKRVTEDLLYIKRQKGIGGVNAEDLAPICLDVGTRVLHQITSIGDFERITDLMGDDVTARKRILKDEGLL